MFRSIGFVLWYNLFRSHGFIESFIYLVNAIVFSTLTSNFDKFYNFVITEPPHGKTNNMHRRKQRRRSAPLFSLNG